MPLLKIKNDCKSYDENRIPIEQCTARMSANCQIATVCWPVQTERYTHVVRTVRKVCEHRHRTHMCLETVTYNCSTWYVRNIMHVKPARALLGHCSSMPMAASMTRYGFLLVFYGDLKSRWNCCPVVYHQCKQNYNLRQEEQECRGISQSCFCYKMWMKNERWYAATKGNMLMVT